jgi:hypothetical protein
MEERFLCPAGTYRTQVASDFEMCISLWFERPTRRPRTAAGEMNINIDSKVADS